MEGNARNCLDDCIVVVDWCREPQPPQCRRRGNRTREPSHLDAVDGRRKANLGKVLHGPLTVNVSDWIGNAKRSHSTHTSQSGLVWPWGMNLVPYSSAKCDFVGDGEIAFPQ